MGVARKYGTGIQFINEMRRRYPRTPGLPNEVYLNLINWMRTYAKAGIQAANALSTLSGESLLSGDMFPKNFWIGNQDSLFSRYMFQVRYRSIDPTSGLARLRTDFIWLSETDILEAIINKLQGRVQDILDRISMSLFKQLRYQIEAGSFVIEAMFSRF